MANFFEGISKALMHPIDYVGGLMGSSAGGTSFGQGATGSSITGNFGNLGFSDVPSWSGSTPSMPELNLGSGTTSSGGWQPSVNWSSLGSGEVDWGALSKAMKSIKQQEQPQQKLTPNNFKSHFQAPDSNLYSNSALINEMNSGYIPLA